MRMLHTMIRVGNLDRSLAFYTELLGMRLLRKRLSGGPLHACLRGLRKRGRAHRDRADPQLGHQRYDLGNGFGHVALGVADAAGLRPDKARGGKSSAKPGR